MSSTVPLIVRVRDGEPQTVAAIPVAGLFVHRRIPYTGETRPTGWSVSNAAGLAILRHLTTRAAAIEAAERVAELAAANGVDLDAVGPNSRMDTFGAPFAASMQEMRAELGMRGLIVP